MHTTILYRLVNQNIIKYYYLHSSSFAIIISLITNKI